MPKKEKITIGITYCNRKEVFANYEKWLSHDAWNADVEILQLSYGKNNLNEILNCHGLVLSGGVDIHPKFYGSNNLSYDFAPENGFQEQRDEFEINAYKAALKNDIPVLGICRGAQLINCILGGSLIQDLGSELNSVHKKDTQDKLHPVNIEAKSLLAEIIMDSTMMINSAHHQAVKYLGAGLRVNAISNEGIFEGFEWEEKTGKPFLLGLQWHPERLMNDEVKEDEPSKKIRMHFVNEIIKSKNKKL
ncbi:MAG: gamma-glutamyl-gamma-aminobutyrate hydrolase family protein [Bacteroidetes bacterium]|nr:gamma-glutamyl-gamma-aminobutyrate hydrolase family protein [Bacteroidota bacterium]MBS1925618.1 gamma-glutamyl-gamma-aminobutyrate hydrolase family protein [Bacteroidota bacterium]